MKFVLSAEFDEEKPDWNHSSKPQPLIIQPAVDVSATQTPDPSIACGFSLIVKITWHGPVLASFPANSENVRL